MIRSLIFVVVFGCGVRVIQFVNEKANFQSYNSYVLIGLKGKNVGEAADPTGLLNRLENQINAEMQRRGYRTSPNPELVLRYEVVASTKTERRDDAFYSPVYSPQIQSFNESIILLELTDFKTKKLVWQASLDMREHNRVTKRKDKLKAAVITLFNTYLYRAGQAQPDKSLFVK